MARRALASAAQLRELDGAWEKVATELGAAVTFAFSQRAKDPLAAIVEHLSRHLPAGSMAALRAENAGLHAQVQELTLKIEQLKRGCQRGGRCGVPAICRLPSGQVLPGCSPRCHTRHDPTHGGG